MYKTIIQIIFCIVISVLSLSQAIANDNVMAGTFYVISYALDKTAPSAIDEPTVTSDMVAGKCEYQGNSCNDAKVILYNSEGVKVSETMLISQSYFQFPKLKENQKYMLELNWPNKISDKRPAYPGKFVSIKISKK